jgi:hypothetical protein
MVLRNPAATAGCGDVCVVLAVRSEPERAAPSVTMASVADLRDLCLASRAGACARACRAQQDVSVVGRSSKERRRHGARRGLDLLLAALYSAGPLWLTDSNDTPNSLAQSKRKMTWLRNGTTHETHERQEGGRLVTFSEEYLRR